MILQKLLNIYVIKFGFPMKIVVLLVLLRNQLVYTLFIQYCTERLATDPLRKEYERE